MTLWIQYNNCLYCVSGNRCSPGYHCQEGSSIETPCSPGYYQPSYRAENVTWCILCTAGQFCNNIGQPQPDGPCDAGKYWNLKSPEMNILLFIRPRMLHGVSSAQPGSSVTIVDYRNLTGHATLVSTEIWNQSKSEVNDDYSVIYKAGKDVWCW